MLISRIINRLKQIKD